MSWNWLSSEENSRVTLADEVARKLRLYITENRSSPSSSDPELGGLLLGWIEQYYPLRVRIEDFEPIISERCGPYALSDAERTVLEEAIRRPRALDLKVTGFFRSYCGREPVINSFDQELFTNYFPNRSDVLLLVQPTVTACLATFRFGDELSTKPRHCFFQFYEGLSQTEDATSVPEPLPILGSVQDSSQSEETATVREPLPVPIPARDLSQKLEAPPSPLPEPLRNFGNQVTSKNRLPWLVAAALVLLLVPAYIQFTGKREPRSVSSASKQVAEPMNQPRVVAADTPQPIQPAPAPASPTPSPAIPASPARPAVAVPPEIRHSVQPEIPSGIRARITDRIVIPLRVRVSSAGEVVGAVLESRGEKDGIHQYLRRAAAKAALTWSFDPAKTKEGIPIMAEREISFVFEPQ